MEAQGPEAAAVRSEVERGTAALVADVRTLHDPGAGPVRRYVVDQARSWVEQPSFEGRPQPPVHHASVSVSVEFDDVARLGAWLSGVGRFAGAQVQGISWDLARGTAARSSGRPARTRCARPSSAPRTTPTPSTWAPSRRARSPTPACSARTSRSG